MSNKHSGKEKPQVSIWLEWGTYVVVALVFFLEAAANMNMSEEGPAYGLGVATASVLVPGIIAIFCGKKNADWASKIKKSLNVAFIIGFLFSLLGLLGYYIYFKIKGGKSEPKLIRPRTRGI